MTSVFVGTAARLGLAAALALLPSVAFAHPGVGATVGFSHGFAHPLTGLDHILAMTTVGMLAYQLGGRALWLVPCAFVLVMAIGGALGMAGISIPFVELGIALSVVVLGAVVALGIKAPLAVAMGLAGLFAIFHGHAHGTEMPAAAAGLSYGAGFVIATALLHLAGIGAGMLIGRAGERRGAVVVRTAGGLVSVAGLALLAGLI
jgi:urease accessory protein